MNIYTIDNDGYIIGIKTVGENYILNNNDIIGIPKYGIYEHYQTGLKKPKSAEQIKEEEIAELNNWLDLRRNIEHPDKETKKTRLLELLG